MANEQSSSNVKNEESKRVLLQFYPLVTQVDTTFWNELTNLKLDKLGLSETPLDVVVTYQLNDFKSSLPTCVSISYESLRYFDNERQRNAIDYFIHGKLIVFNTLEDFNQSDKRNVIIDQGQVIWDSITDASKAAQIDSNLELYLLRFFMIVYADLKQYHYHFWSAFPALNFPSKCLQLGQPAELGNFLSRELCESLLDGYRQLDVSDQVFFVVLHNLETSSIEVLPYSRFWSQTVKSLSTSSNSYRFYFAFIDSSPSSKYPGWPLRNYLAYLYVRFAQALHENYQPQQNQFDSSLVDLVSQALFQPAIHILSIRHNLRDFNRHAHILDDFSNNSSIFKISFDTALVAKAGEVFSIEQFYHQVFPCNDVLDNSQSAMSVAPLPPIIGWERNKERMNRLTPRFVDCSRQMDPVLLSNNAVNLNLKLMKWRLVPELSLENMFGAKCLLLGAGTLGCNIARALLAWGVTTITMVDNGHISYSNPVRQTLYNFEDCLLVDGNRKSKAIAAAEALKRIRPTVNAQGVLLSIPMPGHALAPEDFAAVERDVQQLEKLIDEHDVIFLLMDTRESRWLPTLISASKHKIVLNAALGFDTFLVQRHGLRFRLENELDKQSPNYETYVKQLQLYNQVFQADESTPTTILGSELGCYFCTDVFAPGNSTRDRTLDQQCTVTRPGISMIASGYAVELLASLLQHPVQALAPANVSSQNIRQCKLARSDQALLEAESLLGCIPHQIRGFISRLDQITPCFREFDYCTACSYTIIDKYRSDGFAFLIQAFNNSSILEEITGLDKFHSVGEDIVALDFDEDDEDDEGSNNLGAST